MVQGQLQWQEVGWGGGGGVRGAAADALKWATSTPRKVNYEMSTQLILQIFNLIDVVICNKNNIMLRN